jgi:nicotinamidase-related amidase
MTSSASLRRTAVLALHYQNDVLHPQGRIRVGLDEQDPARPRVISSAGRLIDHAREQDLLLVHVRIAFRADYADLIGNCALFRKTQELGAVQEDTWGSQFFSGLEARCDRVREHVLTHKRTSAFIGTSLELLLQHEKITHLLIAGVATHSVVEMTVRHASDLGYAVTILSDACACADQKLHETSLENMRLVADVRTVDDVFPAEVL